MATTAPVALLVVEQNPSLGVVVENQSRCTSHKCMQCILSANSHLAPEQFARAKQIQRINRNKTGTADMRGNAEQNGMETGILLCLVCIM